MLGSRWVCLALGGTLACAGDAPVDPLGDPPFGRCADPTSALASMGTQVPAPSPATGWLLVYAGSREGAKPAYRTRAFTRLVTHVDSASQPQYWVFTGAIFLHMYAPSGHVFTTWIGGVPATGADWSEYLDSLFVPGAALSRLDSSVALASATRGPPPQPFRIAIMVPYPDPSGGSLEFDGQVYDLASPAGRAGAATAYVHEVIRRFGAAGFTRLRLDGFYWLLEDAPASDVEVITRVAAEIHASALRFLWIPYYTARDWNRWHALGFDA